MYTYIHIYIYTYMLIEWLYALSIALFGMSRAMPVKQVSAINAVHVHVRHALL